MKNKLKIFLCVVMIAVFSFGTCATAYAYTGYPDDIDKATSVVNSYYDNSGLPFALCKRPDNKVVLITFSNNNFLFGDDKVLFSGYPFSENSNFLFNGKYYNAIGALGITVWGYEFDYDNFYSKPKKIEIKDIYDISPKDYLASNLFRGYSLIDTNYNIYQHSDTGDDVLVFPKGETNSPTTPDKPTTSGSNILSSTLNTNLMKSSNPLQEILTLLPILVPVLISFLAIRKGIRFTLQTLRSA
ncbi:hypothetical protein [uncultured Eubacterium sp.]|uniref:hypothetical protein n=1 Tax=uncultured Eubacterium sp. TaxID=165185 RepID=UPI0025E18866|nr:hypothetical protein [uncultured Eubacterium sp.]